jgi:hypothetical protein
MNAYLAALAAITDQNDGTFSKSALSAVAIAHHGPSDVAGWSDGGGSLGSKTARPQYTR